MPLYNVNFSYSLPEWGTFENLEASNVDEATDLAYDKITELYPEAVDLQVDQVKEIKD